MYKFTRIYVYTHKYICLCRYVIGICVEMYAQTRLYKPGKWHNIRTKINIIYIYIPIEIYAQIYVYIYTHYISWLYTYIYIYVFISLVMDMNAHTYSYIYIYIDIYMSKWDGFCNATW